MMIGGVHPDRLARAGMAAFLLVSCGLPGAAVAQQDPLVNTQDPLVNTQIPIVINGSDPANTDVSLQSGESWAQWRRMIARQHAGALWSRFSPFARGVAGNGTPQDGLRAAQVAGMSVAPVAGAARQQSWSLWTQSSSSYLRNTSSALRGKGYTLQGTFGLDRQVGEGTTLGLSYSPSYSSAKTSYNNGRERTWNHMVGVFLSQRLTPSLSLDVQGGYVHQRQKLRRFDSLGVYTGRRTSNGYHFSSALNASTWLNDRLMLSGRLGIVATRDRWRTYTENGPLGATAVPGLKQVLVQGVAEAGLAYWADPLMPYLKAAFNHDLHRRNMSDGSGRSDIALTAGFLWYGDAAVEGLSLDVSGSAVLGRKHQRHLLLNMGLRWAW